VSLCQRISRSLSAVDAECPSRMPRTLRAFFRGCARTFLVVVLLFTGARPGAALPPNLSLSQILHTAWTAKQGPPGDIWALAQSPDGFLLLGTGSGLYRFDGVTFERIVPFNQPDLAFRDITALLALPSGEIWIGYSAGGVSELKNGVLTSYGRLEGVPSGWITSFARARLLPDRLVPHAGRCHVPVVAVGRLPDSPALSSNGTRPRSPR